MDPKIRPELDHGWHDLTHGRTGAIVRSMWLTTEHAAEANRELSRVDAPYRWVPRLTVLPDHGRTERMHE